MIKENIRDEIKVALLEDIFYEKIPVHGRIGRKLSGLLLRKSEIKEYISNKNKVLKDEHLSIHDAAMFLETDEYGVEFLIRLGYLHYIVVGIERRIPLDYIHQFEKRLISVKKIAQIHNKTFDSLLNIILELNIRTICLPGVKNREHSLFLPYFFEIKIKDYFNTSSY